MSFHFQLRYTIKIECTTLSLSAQLVSLKEHIFSGADARSRFNPPISLLWANEHRVFFYTWHSKGSLSTDVLITRRLEFSSIQLKMWGHRERTSVSPCDRDILRVATGELPWCLLNYSMCGRFLIGYRFYWNTKWNKTIGLSNY